MKYVRHKKKGFFLFPESENVWHSHVGNFLGVDGIISAGFVDFNEGVPLCYGCSESLDIGSRDDDAELLRKQMLFKT